MTRNEADVRVARVTADGMTPSGPAETTLQLRCSDWSKGVLSLEYAVSGFEKIRGFSFDNFEGPDAPAARRKLAAVRVRTPRGEVTVRKRVAGYLTQPGVFAFSIDRLDHRLSKEIIGGRSKIAFTVHDSRDRNKSITSEFPAFGESGAVAKAMTGCKGF